MTGYRTLDCRAGLHNACEVCSCVCHGKNAIPWDAPGFNPRMLLLGLAAVAAVLVLIAVLLHMLGFGHVDPAASPAPQVSNVQLRDVPGGGS